MTLIATLIGYAVGIGLEDVYSLINSPNPYENDLPLYVQIGIVLEAVIIYTVHYFFISTYARRGLLFEQAFTS